MANSAFIRVKVETRDKLLRMAREDNTSIGKLLESAIDELRPQQKAKEEGEANPAINLDFVEDQ